MASFPPYSRSHQHGEDVQEDWLRDLSEAQEEGKGNEPHEQTLSCAERRPSSAENGCLNVHYV